MEQEKNIRKPQQKRSIETKEKILDAAYGLFCKKGYYKTSTNEIAKVADVSIGSLYSYFKDKDTILLEILDRYNSSFTRVHEELSKKMDLYVSDPKSWLYQLMEGMVEVHQISKELNREMKFLCYTKPKVASVMEKQHEKIRQMTTGYFYLYKDYIKTEDLEAASIVIFSLIDSVVDQVVFGNHTIDKERILQAGVDNVYKYLMI